MTRHDPVWAWDHYENVSCAGRALHGSELLSGPALASRLRGAHKTEKLGRLLADLNGSFAFMIGSWDSPEVFGVDRLRSIPLFFRHNANGSVIVSRSAYDIASDDATPDEGSRACFLRSGYTLGADTLDPAVQQVSSGCLVQVDPAQGPTVERYHRHTRSVDPEPPIDLGWDSIDDLTRRVGERLVTVLNGRQALVPLSGGYDSRYVVAMLAEHGYENVQLFTYGRPDGFEAKIASRVAETYGFAWEFIDYTSPGFSRYLHGNDFAHYWAVAGNAASLPHVQEPFAFDELRRRDLLAADAVVVPGFCGDLLGGSFIPAEVGLGRGRELLNKGLDEHLFSRLLSLNNHLEPDAWDALRRNVSQSRQGLPEPTELSSFVSEVNAWAVEHRVARYVVNGLRVYEHAGLDWHMPLWDNELMDFWYQVPLDDLVNKRLYDGYLLNRRFHRDGVAISQTPGYAKSPWFRVARGLVPDRLATPLRLLRDRASGTARYDVNAFGQAATWGSTALGPDAPTYDGNICTVLVHRYLHDLELARSGAS